MSGASHKPGIASSLGGGSRSLCALCALALVLRGCVAAAEPHPVQKVANIAAYVAVDYREAVVDGRVIAPDEYQEQNDLVAEAIRLARDLGGSEAARGRLVTELKALAEVIERRDLAERIAGRALAVRSRLVVEFGLEVAPRRAPSLKRARQLYETGCAICHGSDGRARTVAASRLSPPPRSFLDETRMALLSPQQVFHLLTVGLPETGMPAFDTLDETDRWSLAFFVVALRHERGPIRRGEARFAATGPTLSPTPTRLAAMTDAEVLTLLGKAIQKDSDRTAVLAWLRRGASFAPQPAGRFGAIRRALLDGPPPHQRLAEVSAVAPDLSSQLSTAFNELEVATGADREAIALRCHLLLDAAEERSQARTP